MACHDLPDDCKERIMSDTLSFAMIRSVFSSLRPFRPIPYRRSGSRVAFVVCALLTALSPTAAHAWGGYGHRLIARLAETELTPQARAEVARLLGAADDRKRGQRMLGDIADWADDLRDDHPALGRATTRWHYINLGEDRCRYAPRKHCPDGNCVIGAIETQRGILADRKQPAEARARALKFLVHFVGDAHQPLHAGYARDKGGNTFQIRLNGKGSNLHTLWDREIVASAKLGEDRYLQHLLRMPLPDAARMDIGKPIAWTEASCRIVLRDGFYPPRAKIEPAYFTQWRPTADAQMRIAGHRLAAMLNDTLSTAPARTR
jgi:nuclease S1